MKVYFGVIAFLTLFGAIYELFGHGVYSYFMVYAFAIPMIFGFLPCLLLYPKMPKEFPQLSFRLYDAGITTLTLGSILKGALDIYGTTNRLLILYPMVGVALTGSALFMARTDRKST